MSDHEETAHEAEDVVDELQREGDLVDEHVEEAKRTVERTYDDPVIAEPLDDENGEDAPERD